MALNFKVYLDGEKIGAVGNGATETFEIPAGTHKMSCKQGMTTASDICEFSINDNETRLFQVGFVRPAVIWIVMLVIGVSMGSSFSWIRSYNTNIDKSYRLLIFSVVALVAILLLRVLKVFYIGIKTVW